MNATCTALDASHLLRNILQTKDNYQAQYIDNSSKALSDVYARSCNSEMISPLLQSKSGDMAYNVRENDTDLDNDGDIDVATDTASCANGGDQSDDLDERSLDTSGQEDNSKGVDHQSFLGDSKEAKRAHVENILTSMRQSPPQDTFDSSTSALAGDFKRQKRKQPQPQQHESITLQSEELALRRQILQLQEQMQAVKRKRDEDLSANDDDDDIIDDDLTDVESIKADSPLNGVVKRARVETMLSAMRSSPHIVTGIEIINRVSPGSENGKRQKRKQMQPQQHDRSEQASNSIKYNMKLGDDRSINEDNLSGIAHQSGLYGTQAVFRNNIFHPMVDKEFAPSIHNGFDSHLYRENLFRHNFFGLRPDFDPIATAFKKVTKIAQMRTEPGAICEDLPKMPATDLTRIAVALKSELTQAVSEAIDNAVSKVFSEKQTSISNIQSAAASAAAAAAAAAAGAADANSQQHQQQQQQQHEDRHHQQEHQQSFPQQNHQQPTNSFPLFPHQNQQPQQQQQRLQHPHNQQQHQQQLPTHFSEREALKETANNSQGKKKPDLVPFSNHLHFLECFGNRFHHDKMSAFDPLNKSDSELITPHNGPSLPFHPHFPYYLPSQVLSSVYTGEPEQTEALSLIVNTPKKKRTKVTDTRLSSPRGKSSVLQDNTPSSSMDHTDAQRHLAVAFPHFLPPVLPTSVAITNPSLSHSDFLALRLRESNSWEPRLSSPQDQSRGSPRSLTDSPQFMSKMDMYDRGGLGYAADLMDGNSSGSGLLTSTLTPMHLRKAKLMFFYTRYPSSSILKMYFPDVMFNKNNTAQLVKWFSNFREFFYIQMEKYARQALAEGCKHADDLVVTADSELFRHLNLHYNRNNQLEVPHNFLASVQAALREFFKSIQSNKDAEPSWKKSIYKIIARMDETLPDFFKSPNWMEQLGDQ